MAIKLTPESFLNVVKQSNLVTGDVLKRVISDLRAEGVAVDNSRAIADCLVERNLLTRWQADKLLQGKHKGFFLGKYRLLKLLGKGGMSSVYLAEHVLMRRQCAIKVLPTKRVNDTSYLGRFHREAQAVASLDHPNIIKAYDVDKEMEKDTEIHFLVMEFVDGRSLQEIVQQDGPLDYQTAADYIRQSAEGLAHAHAAGMVHRDIKPGNLLIDRTEIVKLLDMGLARFFHDTEEESLTVAHDEKVLGTADYLAPEQALDSHSVDARADLYSLGCTFYFLLTGHPPFTEGTLAQRLMSHQTKQPPAVTDERPDMPSELLAILEKMMAKNREERYQTAGEIAQDLGRWLVEHASDDWQQSHPALSGSGKKLSGSGKNLPAPAPKNLPVAKPLVPVAKPVVAPQKSESPSPAPSALSEAASDAGQELSAFLAHLGSSDSSGQEDVEVQDSTVISATNKPSNRPESPESKERKSPKSDLPAESSPPIAPQAAPVLPAQAVPAKPVVSARPVSPKPSPMTAKPASPVASADSEDSFSAVLVEEPEFPAFDSEFAIDTASNFQTSPTATYSSKTPKPAAKVETNMLKNKSLLMGVAGLVVVLILGFGIYWTVTNWGSGDPDGIAPGFDPEDPSLLGKPILVGTDGSIPTLKEALVYVARHYEPSNFGEPQVIELAPGEVFEERIDLNNSGQPQFPHTVRITTDAKNPATLKPAGADPVIRLIKGIHDLHIQHLKIDAEGKDSAIRLEGSLENTRLIGLEIGGYETTGIDGESVFGGWKFGEADRSFIIEDCTFQGGSDSTAIRMENKGSGLSFETLEEIIVRNCRFLGPMKTGMEVKNKVTSLRVLSNIFAGDGTGTGIQWTGTIDLDKVIIGNNTFYNLSRGITFAEMPVSLNSFGLHRNLFAEIKTHEAALLEDDANEFAGTFLKGAALDANSTTGEKTKAGDKTELKLFTGKTSQSGVKLSFVSTEPGTEGFLAPKEADTLAKPTKAEVKVGSLEVELKNQIGAVAP